MNIVDGYYGPFSFAMSERGPQQEDLSEPTTNTVVGNGTNFSAACLDSVSSDFWLNVKAMYYIINLTYEVVDDFGFSTLVTVGTAQGVTRRTVSGAGRSPAKHTTFRSKDNVIETNGNSDISVVWDDAFFRPDLRRFWWWPKVTVNAVITGSGGSAKVINGSGVGSPFGPNVLLFEGQGPVTLFPSIPVDVELRSSGNLIGNPILFGSKIVVLERYDAINIDVRSASIGQTVRVNIPSATTSSVISKLREGFRHLRSVGFGGGVSTTNFVVTGDNYEYVDVVVPAGAKSDVLYFTSSPDGLEDNEDCYTTRTKLLIA